MARMPKQSWRINYLWLAELRTYPAKDGPAEIGVRRRMIDPPKRDLQEMCRTAGRWGPWGRCQEGGCLPTTSSCELPKMSPIASWTSCGIMLLTQLDSCDCYNHDHCQAARCSNGSRALCIRRPGPNVPILEFRIVTKPKRFYVVQKILLQKWNFSI